MKQLNEMLNANANAKQHWDEWRKRNGEKKRPKGEYSTLNSHIDDSWRIHSHCLHTCVYQCVFSILWLLKFRRNIRNKMMAWYGFSLCIDNTYSIWCHYYITNDVQFWYTFYRFWHFKEPIYSKAVDNTQIVCRYIKCSQLWNLLNTIRLKSNGILYRLWHELNPST